MNQISSRFPDATGEQSSGTDAWAAFTSAPGDGAFCRAWLALQCQIVAGVDAALLLLRDGNDPSYVPAAVWPDPSLRCTNCWRR